MMETKFQKIYQQLNEKQRTAIDAIEGPVMVLAGPGTGKTQVLSVRIANILQKTDTSPDAILALTFTESAAKNMQERLTSIIGVTAYYVNISTFHSFCTNVIQNNPDQFFVSLEAEPLSELEKMQIIKQILDQHHFDKLKPTNTPYFYCREILRRLSELKREGITVKEFERIIVVETQNLASLQQNKKPATKTGSRDVRSYVSTEEKNLIKNKELLTIYEAYQKEIAIRNRFDFEDMINFVVEKFKSDEDFLRQYQERFQYFLVDEYQDTNSAQNEVLRLLSSFWGDKANVFVVGDPNQSIYRFQGACLENILGFEKQYPRAKIITLTDNYRSSQTILNASFDLIQKNNLPQIKIKQQLNQKLIGRKKLQEVKINYLSLPSDTVEEYFIVHEIKKLIRQKVNPEEIAVLYRNNADSGGLADLFSKEKILYNLEGGTDVLTDPTINKLIKLFQLIEKSKTQTDDLELFTVLHYEFLNFDPLDILKLSRAGSEQKKHLIEIIDSRDVRSYVPTSKKFTDLLNQLAKWQKDDATYTFSQFFEIVIQESGYLNWILDQSDRIERLNRLNSLFAEIKSLNRTDHTLNLGKFLGNVELMRQNNLRINEEDLDLTQNAVTLSTVHKAKGKEWEYVFIIKAIDGKWGNARKKELIKLPEGILKYSKHNSYTAENLSSVALVEEERRLFYVVLTRAKKKVYVTYSETTTANGNRKENIPTRFLTEIEDKYLEKPAILDLDAPTILNKLFVPGQKQITTTTNLKEKEFLQNLLQGFKLSPTALDTYLECPYKFKLNNLIRIPRAKEVYLSFGTATHRALELFYRKLKNEGQLPSKEYLLKEFKKALKKEVLTPNDELLQLEKGQQILGLYYDYYQQSFIPALFTEYFFGYGYSKTYLYDIPLSGKVDRIDLIDREQKTVKIVDYKTGKPKSRNFIEGKTQNSDGNYKRQLIFYKLLSQLDHNFPLQVAEAELNFVEPDSYGKFKKESFIISEEEIDELKILIREVMKRIRNLEFPCTTDCQPCSRCEFKDHCLPERINPNI